MALLIKTSGEITKVTPKNGSSFALEELQGYVGGLIELVREYNLDLSRETIDDYFNGKRPDMYINEEGKIHDLPVNMLATSIYEPDNDVIVGDVLLATPKECGEDDDGN